MAGMNSEGLSALAGILLSLGFSYIPGVSQRFGELAPTQKRLVMLGLLLACALGVFGLSCLQTGWLSAPTCDRAGAWGLARVFAAALIANQAAFTVSPRLERPTRAARQGGDAANALVPADPAETGRLDETGEPEEAVGLQELPDAPEAEAIKKRVRRLSRPEGAYARPVKKSRGADRSDGEPNQSVQDARK